MVRVISIDNCDIDDPTFVTFPGVAVNGDLWGWYFDDSRGHITSLFFKLPHCIFLKLLTFHQSCWKLHTKFANGGSEIGNHNEFRRLIVLFDDGDHFNPINSKTGLLPIWPIDCLISINQFLPDRIADIRDAQPFLLEYSLLREYLALAL
jgi:hypothetical protein